MTEGLTPVAAFEDRFREMLDGDTYENAAARIGISRASVGAYATGTRSPKKPVLMAMAHAYHVNPLWLLGYDVPKYKEVPASGGDLSDMQKQLMARITTLSDDEVRAVRAIVDQVLSLREGKPDQAPPGSD
jgi:transcriptional regulator with XRE-family HTH domain